ncbi:hypothetical protein EXIGLDRAFT_731967 [Exidia glandulosa HHB12029]|uniref:F-box domain-containing protein n=1 Tax=Exidia glandulosa HHB12029 TaxID=1314781 RepID=A0A165BPB1_EXIGL|nr:hypothetical protein EXIGLDRAFT_731967 [Exidia glandulosa HHB12029]
MLSSAFGPAPSLSLPPDFDYSRFVLPELLLCIFDHLPQKDLISASGTCRRWRALAHAHANLYYHLALDVDLARDDMPQTLNEFCAGLLYLRTSNLRARVVVDWTKVTPAAITVDQTTGLEHPAALPPTPQSSAAVQTVMEAIGNALSVITKLELVFGCPTKATLEEDVFPHLCRAAAPQLEKFSLDVLTLSTPVKNYPSVPDHLFAGAAPKLAHVCLSGVLIKPQPIPALLSASALELNTPLTGTENLLDLVPRVQELTLRGLWASDLAKLYPLVNTLQKLTFVVAGLTTNVSEQLRPLAQIPQTSITVVVDDSSDVSKHLSFAPFFENLKRRKRPLSLRLNEEDTGFPTLAFSDADSVDEAQLIRAFCFMGCTNDELRAVLAANLRPLGAYIGRVAVGEHFLELLPDCFVTLPVMDALVVYWDDALESTNAPRFANTEGKRVHCPNLWQLWLVSLEPESRPEVRAERLQRVLRPGKIPVLQQYSGVRLKQRLVQKSGDGDFAVVDSDEGYNVLLRGYDADGHLSAVQYGVKRA